MVHMIRMLYRVPLLCQSLGVDFHPIVVFVWLDVVNVHGCNIDHIRRRVLDDFVQRRNVVLLRYRVGVLLREVFAVRPPDGWAIAYRIVQQMCSLVRFVALCGRIFMAAEASGSVIYQRTKTIVHGRDVEELCCLLR